MSVVDFSKLYPDNRQEGETVLRQAQLVMLRMLKIIDYICRKHDISYWMCSGTLLGAVRHKGFIPCLTKAADPSGHGRRTYAIPERHRMNGYPTNHHIRERKERLEPRTGR